MAVSDDSVRALQPALSVAAWESLHLHVTSLMKKLVTWAPKLLSRSARDGRVMRRWYVNSLGRSPDTRAALTARAAM